MASKLSTGGDSDDLELNGEINVTPFIDVILVLLIIFMVAAPLSTVDVNVELPASTATPVPRPDKPVFVSLKEDKTLALGDDVDRARRARRRARTARPAATRTSASSCAPTSR